MPTPVCPKCRGDAWAFSCDLCKGRRYVRLTDRDVAHLSWLYRGHETTFTVTISDVNAVLLMRHMNLKPQHAIEEAIRNLCIVLRQRQRSGWKWRLLKLIDRILG